MTLFAPELPQWFWLHLVEKVHYFLFDYDCRFHTIRTDSDLCLVAAQIRTCRRLRYDSTTACATETCRLRQQDHIKQKENQQTHKPLANLSRHTPQP